MRECSRLVLVVLLLGISRSSSTATGGSGYFFPPPSKEETEVRPSAEPSTGGASNHLLHRIYDKLDVLYGVDIYRVTTRGNTSRAFRPAQTFQLHNLSLGYRDRYGDIDVDVQSALRWTDDITITHSRDAKIQSFHAGLERRDVWSLRVGDIFPNLSNYTFNRSAQNGTNGWYRWPALGGNLRLTGAVGITNREQEFTGGTEPGQYRRYASGGALDWEGDGPGPFGKMVAGFRVSDAHDELSSITSRNGRGGTPIPRLDIVDYSFKYDVALPAGISWRGEDALSDGNRDRTKSPSLHRIGTAHNSALDWRRPSDWGEPRSALRLLPIGLRGDFEWVDPDFLTELGSAAVDQMRWDVNSDFRWSDALDWTASYLRNEDNVRNRIKTGTVPVTNISQNTTFRMNSRPFGLFLETGAPTPAEPTLMPGDPLSRWFPWNPNHLRDFRYTYEFRYNDRGATNNTVNTKIEDYDNAVNYRNWGIDWRGGYKYQLTDDDVRSSNDRRNDEWNVGLARPFTYSIWEIRVTPTAGFRHSADRFRNGSSLTVTRAGDVGFGAAWGEFNVQTGYTVSEVDRNAPGTDVRTSQFTGSVGFRPIAVPDLNLTASVRRQNVKEDNPANSYRELEVRGHVDYRF